ncbi:MAG TPA: hypothetical protein VEY70_12105, partial [Metabacillus sp.]|nr:hypothetical protein [Metabacillus sp.]
MKKRLKTFQYNFKWRQKCSFLTLVLYVHLSLKEEIKNIAKVITDAEKSKCTSDKLCSQLALLDQNFPFSGG